MTTRAPASDAAPTSIFSGRYRLTTVGVLTVITMIAFEAMAVGAALPTAARDLHALGAFGWAYTGFIVASIVGLIVAGQLSDSRGPRDPLVLGLITFTAGLVVSGSAADMPMLVAGRVVQGFGGGLLITVVYVVIGQVYPDSLTPKVFAAMSTAWVFPSLVGPVLSGVLAQHVNWRWVFLGLLPFALVGCALMAPVLRSLHRPEERLEPRKAIPYALGAAVAIAGLEQLGQDPPAVVWVVLGAAAAVAVLGWALHRLMPTGAFTFLLPVRPRSSHGRPVAGPVVMRGLLAGSFFGIEALVPLSLQVQHHYGATLAGIPLAFAGTTWAIGSWWQGREHTGDEMTHRVHLVRAGFTFLTIAAVGVAYVSQAHAAAWLIYPVWSLAGVGAGLTMASFGVLLLRYTDDEQRGADSAALQLSDSTGSALTTGVAGVLVAAAARGTLGYGTAFAALDLAMAAIALVGVLSAGRLRVSDRSAPGAS